MDVIVDVLAFVRAAPVLALEDVMDAVVVAVHVSAAAVDVAAAVAAVVAVAAVAAVVAVVVGTDAMAVNLLTQAAVADIANVQIIQVSDKYVSRRIC